MVMNLTRKSCRCRYTCCAPHPWSDTCTGRAARVVTTGQDIDGVELCDPCADIAVACGAHEVSS